MPKKPTVKAGETKKDAFKRVASRYTREALKCMSRLESLMNESYESTTMQHDTIVSALKKGVDELHKAFKGEKKQEGGFTL